MTQTTDQPTDTQRLAKAILYLAKAGTHLDSCTGARFCSDRARSLVRNIAYPNFTQPSPVPEPSCDSPHCDCVEGGDCRANVAGGTYEDGEGRIRQLTAAVPDLLTTHDQWVGTLRPAGPVFTMALVDGRMTIFSDGKPAPDHPWQQALDAQQHEADRVMVRAISPLRVLLPIVSSDHTRTFVLDAASTGHRAPFRPGDLVVQAGAFDAIQRVVEVADDVEGTFCREIHLVVKRADVVVDADAF